MTAIAYRDGVLAADSSCFQGAILGGKSRKIWRLADGRLFAASGRIADTEACRQWIEDGGDPVRRPSPCERESFAAFVIGPGARDVVKIEWDFRPFTAPEAEFWAIGCHYEFLLGAMAAGAAAAAAVELACRYGDGAVGPIQIERLNF
ncbi:MAG TPA: hypothetical protein VGF07_02025 [Stellaceae bacterium]|jgi:ATP-dependent HslUV protease subunit HslV